MHYKVKIIQIKDNKAQLTYSNNVTGQYISLATAMNHVRDYLSDTEFDITLDELHYYIEICDQDPDTTVFCNYLYCGDYMSILNKKNHYATCMTEEEVLELAFPTKSQFEVET